MRKLMNVLFVVLIAAILIAGGVGGYLWYSTKQQADQIVMMAQPFAEISYGGIVLSPTGSTGVKQVRIMPHFVNDVITIGTIQLNAPNILALLDIRRHLSQGKPPPALSLSFHDVELSLHGGLLGPAPSQVQHVSPFDNLDALGCGPVTRFSGAEWQEMGFERFVGNLEVGYRLDAARNRLELRVDSHTRNWAALNLDIGLAVATSPQSVMDLASFTPQLASLRFVLRDDGFNALRNNYCAVKAGKTIPDYIADHVRLVAERLRANGIALGPGLLEAYRRYLTEGGHLTVVANPPVPIDPAELQFYAAEDVVKLLGLTLQVNETAVADLSIAWDAAKVAEALGSEARPEPDVVETPPVRQQPVIVRQDYHPTPVGELGRHVGRNARLQTTTGARYLGRLDAVAEGVVRITIRRSGGTVTLSLRAGDITAAEVVY
jgi:hypothetical protein